MRRSRLVATRAGVVALLTAAATFFIAAPAYGAGTYANITCYDHTWPANNEIRWWGEGLGYPPSTDIVVYELILKNESVVVVSNTYPVMRTTIAGTWKIGTKSRTLGKTEGGTWRLSYSVYTRSGQYLGYDTESCTIS